MSSDPERPRKRRDRETLRDLANRLGREIIERDRARAATRRDPLPLADDEGDEVDSLFSGPLFPAEEPVKLTPRGSREAVRVVRVALNYTRRRRRR